MSGINQQVAFGINRLKVTFIDDLGNQKTISGTGFWVTTDSHKTVFVTNKHNLDPTLKLGKSTKFTLHEVKIELRKIQGTNALPETKFFLVSNLSNAYKAHTSADVAVLISPAFNPYELGFTFHPMVQSGSIADDFFLKNQVKMMDFASFVGFPGTSDSEWWDQAWNLPVARIGSIASLPFIPTTNIGIKTSDVSLITGLSFAGSSGSPLFLHEKGINTGPESDITFSG